MSTSDITQIFAFLIELDKLKAVLRQSYPVGLDRRENSAEHSWQIALGACLLVPYACRPVNATRATEMLLLHDIPEILIGDTLVYAAKSADAFEKERQAALKIFKLLPESLANWAFSRWEEFELQQTDDAKFARAVDRMMPVLQNLASGGPSWANNNVPFEKIVQVNGDVIDAILPTAWAEIYVRLQAFRLNTPLAHWQNQV